MGGKANATSNTTRKLRIGMSEPSKGPGSSGALERHLAVAQSAYEAGKLSESAEHAKRAIGADPNSPSGHFMLGIALLAQKMFVEAAQCFQRASKLNPGFANYPFHLGLALGRAGHLDEARAALRNAIQLDPKFLPPYQALAQLLSAQGDRASAIDLLQTAQKLKPDAATSIQLAQSLYLEARIEEAESEVRRALEMNPRSVPAYDLLSSLLQETGRFEEAFVVAQRGLDIKPTSGSLSFRIVKSKRLTEEDLPTIDRMEGALRTRIPDPQDVRFLHYALGKAWDDLGRYKEASSHWDLANQLSERLQFGGKLFPRDRYRDSFDRIMNLFPRRFFDEKTYPGSSDERPVFIVGLMRSGTTLVEQILSSHPDIAAGGELRFWLDLIDEDSRWCSRFVKGKQEDLDPIVQEYLELLSDIAPGAKRVTDKMPNNYMVLGPIHALFPKARIIHCRRDAADNAISIYATPFGEPPKFAYNKENIVFGIEQYARLMAHWREALPDGAMLEIRYEELVQETERVTRQMIDFCGLPWNDACLHHAKNDRVVRTPSVWQVRQPIYDHSVGRWRNYEPWLGPFKKLVGRSG